MSASAGCGNLEGLHPHLERGHPHILSARQWRQLQLAVPLVRRALGPGDPNIRAIPKGQTVHFLFRDRVLLRFKKANSSGLGSNIETQAVLEFTKPQIPLFDLPPIFRVEACYRLDKLATRIAALTVNARQGKTRLWSYELARVTGAEIIALPPRPSGDNALPEVRVRKLTDKPETRGE
jgi:hypothetical protein